MGYPYMDYQMDYLKWTTLKQQKLQKINKLNIKAFNKTTKKIAKI